MRCSELDQSIRLKTTEEIEVMLVDIETLQQTAQILDELEAAGKVVVLQCEP